MQHTDLLKVRHCPNAADRAQGTVKAGDFALLFQIAAY